MLNSIGIEKVILSVYTSAPPRSPRETLPQISSKAAKEEELSQRTPRTYGSRTQRKSLSFIFPPRPPSSPREPLPQISHKDAEEEELTQRTPSTQRKTKKEVQGFRTFGSWA